MSLPAENMKNASSASCDARNSFSVSDSGVLSVEQMMTLVDENNENEALQGSHQNQAFLNNGSHNSSCETPIAADCSSSDMQQTQAVDAAAASGPPSTGTSTAAVQQQQPLVCAALARARIKQQWIWVI